MRLTGHKNRSVFDRYNIVSESDLNAFVERLGRTEEAIERNDRRVHEERGKEHERLKLACRPLHV